MSDHYLYLALNLGSISIPFIASFDKRLALNKNFLALFKAIALVGAFFIIWDVIFTDWGVWGFNPTYLSGIYIANLPLGEWLFFICIPFACVFTYISLNYLVKKDHFASVSPIISGILVLGLLGTAIYAIDRWYTATTFLLTAAFIIYVQWIHKAKWLSRFYFSYLFILIPFFLVNGVLTGSWIPDQVVWYDDTQNLGIRMGTIPVEDTFYGMLLIMGNVFFFEKWKKPVV